VSDLHYTRLSQGKQGWVKISSLLVSLSSFSDKQLTRRGECVGWENVPTEVSEVYPNEWLNAKQIAHLQRSYNEAVSSEEVVDPSVPPIGSPLTDEELARRRLLHAYPDGGEVWKALGPRWGPAFLIYEKTLPREVLPIWREELTVIRDIRRISDSRALFNYLKAVTVVYKKLGEVASPYWRFFVNMELFGGYLWPTTNDKLVPEIREWVEGDIEHELPTRTGAFDEGLRDGFRQHLALGRGIRRANEKLKTVAQFAADPEAYATQGSSMSTRPLPVTKLPSGKVVKVKKTKAATMLTYTPDEVEDMILHAPAVQEARVIQKREAGKVRGVVNSDDLTYLRMSYISSWLNDAQRGNTSTTLYMSSSQTIRFWETVVEQANAPGVWKMPLDQGSFDKNQSKKMIALFFDELRLYMQRHMTPGEGKKQMLRVLQLVKEAIIDKEGLVLVPAEGKFPGEKLKYQKGVLSGWYWTAMLDTALNYATFVSIRKCAEQAGIFAPVTSLCAQGDDDQVSSSSKSFLFSLVHLYDRANFDLNTAKFFMSTRRDEFLRLVAEGSRLVGYPARMLLSLLWRNPITPAPPTGTLRLTEQLDQWYKYMGRGATHGSRQMMIQDMSRANKLQHSVIKAYLRTPKAYDGAGAVIEQGAWASVVVGDMKGHWKLVPQQELPAVRPQVEILMGVGVPEDFAEKQVAQRYNGMLTLREQGVMAKEAADDLQLIPERSASVVWTEGTSPYPASPHWKDTSLTTLQRDVLVDYRMEERRWDAVDDMLQEENGYASKRMRKRLGLKVWRWWIKGKLPGGAPKVMGWDDRIPGQLYEERKGRCLLIASQLPNPGEGTWRATAHALELHVRSLLQVRPYLIGN
jgi:hypothetical protein